VTAGRTVVVTGASSGIGLAGAVALARRGDSVALVGRHRGRLDRAVDLVRDAGGRTPPAYRADFAVLDEVRAVADRIAADLPRVDVLVNNAGRLAWPGTTVDGYDPTMQINHLGGFLLTNLLLPRLRAAGSARVVTTASLAEAWGWLDVDRPARSRLRYGSRWLAYGSSKQANILFTVEAARRWTGYGIVATCFFPGLVRSRFATSSPMFMLGKLIPVLVTSPRRAADTLVWLAGADEARVPGGYFFRRSPFAATPRATDPERARRLWDASLSAVGLPLVVG
jgi:NAD(P)-dependent dehydrogenase (short-subunit alcohol dehydrogenase family)